MKRNYEDRIANDVEFFVGTEVEHTPAWGMLTLFVTGLHNVSVISEYLGKYDQEIKHIFFGANHSYDPISPSEHDQWESMITYFLNEDYLCSLDIPINQVEEFNDSGLCEYNNFIPQIRVSIPYIKLWNYNTTIKIDDIGFNETNPGVWSHSLHTLMDRSKFADWNMYKNDKVLK